MNKPLSEWTLAEIKAECKKHTLKCTDCPFWTDANCRIHINMVLGDYPEKWDLSEPPGWTEQDREDAKMIKRVFNGVQIGVARDNLAQLRTIAKVGFPSEYINSDMFPLLKPGESAMLDEIIGGGE